MWRRKDLKRKAKAAFKANYWKAVLVAIIMTSVAAGGAAGLSSGSSAATTGSLAGSSKSSVTVESDFYEDMGDELPEDLMDELPPEIQDAIREEPSSGFDSLPKWAKPFIALFVVAMIVIAVLAVIFLILPLEAGCCRFFYQNLLEKAEVKEVAYGYDHGYKNVIKTLFVRDIFLFLWCLLLIIPGIIKAYQYRMIPYILAEHPDMPRKEVFYYSKMMMKGNKWKAFVLDLSFIGWWILSGLTLGILSIFYVNPYYQSTCAALYQALAYGGNGQGQAVQGGFVPAQAAPAEYVPAQPETVPAEAEAPEIPDQAE